MLHTKSIKTQKHARIITLGDFKSTDEIWLVLHGYAQNIFDFAKHFEGFEKNRSFIFPEALSRFYQRSTVGKVGASWMTSDERDLEKVDQRFYLNQVFQEFNLGNRQVNYLGFSQGAAALSRWIQHEQIAAQRFILWSGNIPDEIVNNEWIKSQEPEFHIGKNDQFASQEKWANYLKQHNLTNYNIYEGDHFFNHELLKKFVFNQ